MDAKERDRLGRMVRDLWISWADCQPNAKPGWIVPYDSLSESEKEADRVIGEGLMFEFYAETTGERLEHEALKRIAMRLRDELHGFRELFDENDPSSGKAIREYDEFVGGVYLENEWQPREATANYAERYAWWKQRNARRRSLSMPVESSHQELEDTLAALVAAIGVAVPH